MILFFFLFLTNTHQPNAAAASLLFFLSCVGARRLFTKTDIPAVPGVFADI